MTILLAFISTTSLADTPKTDSKVKDVLIVGPSPLTPSQIRPYYQSFLEHSTDAEQLEKLRLTIAKAYDDAGWGLVSVSTPIIQSNIAVIRVSRLTLSNITVSTNDLEKTLPELDVSSVLPELAINKQPNLKVLDAQLRLAQLQPHRRWEVNFKANDKDDTNNLTDNASLNQSNFAIPSDRSLSKSMDRIERTNPIQESSRLKTDKEQISARVIVSEDDPWYGRMIFDNAGQQATGRERIRMQIGNGDLFGPGRALDMTLLTSTNSPSDQYQIALRYQHPLPQLSTLLSAETWYSRSDSGTQAGFFDVSSNSHGYSLAARKVLQKRGDFLPFAEISIESSVYDNVIDFFGVNVGNKVGQTPIALTLGTQYQLGAWGIYGQMRGRQNLAWGESNNTSNYQAARVGATTNWKTFDGVLVMRRPFGNNREGVMHLQAQYSRDALIAPAQFRVGGSQAMRGLQEGELAGDYGLAISAEHWWTLNNHHRVSVWVDAAEASRHKSLVGEATNASALSSGASWQWNLNRSWQLNTTAAKVLNTDDLSVTNSGDTRLQLALNWTF